MKNKEKLQDILKKFKFSEIEEGYEYSNKKCTVYINGEDNISIISTVNMDIEYLSIPSLKVYDSSFLSKVFKSLGVL